ncbi:MAG TPA: ABC transporter substrate-binding protein [Terriglobales bacterium]|nr:ABC transporter substrate-binding protein [Terriglobales bacterium]
MSRSAFRLLLLAVAVLCSAHATSDAAGPRIGFLSPSTPEGSAFVLAALRQGLREHGYVDGANITIESRFAYDRFDRLPELARELIALPVDVLVTFVTQASIAAKQNTRTIPIVMVGVSDPVASGLVSSLSHPEANITGTSGAFTGLAGKCVQLLQEAIPGLNRIAILWNPANRVFQAQMLEETRASARQLGIELQLFEARESESIEAAFAAISKQRIRAVSVLPDPVFAANWSRIAALATKSRLPSVTVSSAYAEAGGLMAYGPSIPELARTAAGYVAKILKGAKPAELPVERPTKFELVINVKTAKQIGMAVPQPLRLRADRLIE